MKIFYFTLFLSGILTNAIASEQLVIGRNFNIPATQNIFFVPLKNSITLEFEKTHVPRILDLSEFQSSVKNQGQRGTCTYFVITSLIESLFKKEFKKNLDLSEEYIAWASKAEKGLRANEEGSSVAVNAVTVQELGLLLEEDMPYQPSWFEEGYPCAGQKNAKIIDPICYSHAGPNPLSLKNIINADNIVFEAVGSSSLELIKALSHRKNPVSFSMLGHPDTWETKTGELKLTKKMKEECQKKLVKCGGHSILVTGYDMDRKVFTVKNSWGENWGNRGYGTISFDYIDQMSSRLFLTGYIER